MFISGFWSAGALRQIEDDRHRQAMVFAGKGDERLTGFFLHIRRVYHVFSGWLIKKNGAGFSAAGLHSPSITVKAALPHAAAARVDADRTSSRNIVRV